MPYRVWWWRGSLGVERKWEIKRTAAGWDMSIVVAIGMVHLREHSVMRRRRYIDQKKAHTHL